MRVTRTLDVAAIVLLAAVLLMPRPNATVKAALPIQPERRERVAELQALLLGAPKDQLTPTIELANIYLDGRRPDWALATVGAILPRHPDDFRLHHLRAIAYADRFEAPPAFEAAKQALALCERKPPAGPTCGEAEHARLSLLTSTLQKVAHVDMRKNPALAKEKILEGLRPAYIPKKRIAKQPAPAPDAR